MNERLTAEDVTAIVEAKNELVRENYRLRAENIRLRAELAEARAAFERVEAVPSYDLGGEAGGA